MKNQYKLFIITIIGVLSVIPLSVFAPHSQLESALVEESIILQTGKLFTTAGEFKISNDFDIRIFAEGAIMRVSGITTEGFPYYVYHLKDDEKTNIKGKILIDENWKSVVEKENTVTEQVQTQPNQIELLILGKSDHFVYLNDKYDITIKIFDASKNTLKNFDQNYGGINGINVNISLDHEDGTHLTSFNGTTENNGFYKDGYFVSNTNVKTGKYFVTVSVSYNNNEITQGYTMFIRNETIDEVG